MVRTRNDFLTADTSKVGIFCGHRRERRNNGIAPVVIMEIVFDRDFASRFVQDLTPRTRVADDITGMQR